jgi:putative ABC transport system substrate-binding protein
MASNETTEFIALLGAGAITSPVASFAQDGTRMRKVAILVNFEPDDAEGRSRIKAFADELQRSGWIEGKNLHTEVRWAGESAERYRAYAKELIAFRPDALLASAGPGVAALQQATRDVPIIFANVIVPSELDLLLAWRGPAVTQRDLLFLSTALMANGLSCSRS